MREIKFRAWYKKEKSMLNWIIVQKALMGVSDDDRWTLMQFTGLTDRNGKEIFEGDVVEDVSNSGLIFEVKWDELLGGYFTPSEYDDEYIYGLGFIDELEIIGNLYETPELLDNKD